MIYLVRHALLSHDLSTQSSFVFVGFERPSRGEDKGVYGFLIIRLLDTSPRDKLHLKYGRDEVEENMVGFSVLRYECVIRRSME